MNQQKMQEALNDYEKMFGKKYELSQIRTYNENLNDRLARKEAKFLSRKEQLDLVIVVDRLLTGFDAPCLSTIFIDRQPMGPHDLIQAFSRTNRIFDKKNKAYGQIVTFQAPVLFKQCVDNVEMQDVDLDYELMAYSNTKIDYEYIIRLIQNIVTPKEEDESVTREERRRRMEEAKQYVEELRKENPRVAGIMSDLIYEIELDENKYKGQSILNIVENMKQDCIDKVVSEFCITWYASKEDVMYAATHYRNGKMIEALRKTLEEEIKPLISN